MTDQLNAVALRLLEAGNPNDVNDWQQKDGYYVATCRVSPDDSRSLIELARKWIDCDWPDEDLGLDAEVDELQLLPVSAWRCLADMKDEQAAEPLAQLLGDLEDEGDDWTSDEFPWVFGKIGKAAIEPLVRLVNDSTKFSLARCIASESLQKIAEYHPATRDEVVGVLKSFMSKACENDVEVNSFAVWSLVELRGIEAAVEIEQAFAANRIDVSICGNWDCVRADLGIEKGLGLEMPQSPISSWEIDQETESSVFCNQPIFCDGDIDSDAADEYYSRAYALYSASPEGLAVIEQNGHLNWTHSLLEFGLSYLGETVDFMDRASVTEFLFDYCPRKVSVEAEESEAILFDLTRFWEFLNREFAFKESSSIIEWLKAPGLSKKLSQELSDPRNFGIAKSIIMSGVNAGFDMTTEEGINQYMSVYNAQILGSNQLRNSNHNSAEPEPYYHNTPVRVERIGRNESCPCGSGKKHKKCCLRGG